MSWTPSSKTLTSTRLRGLQHLLQTVPSCFARVCAPASRYAHDCTRLHTTSTGSYNTATNPQVYKEAAEVAAKAHGSYGSGIGEELLSWLPVISGLREFAESLEAGGQLRPNNIKVRHDGQLVVDVFPLGYVWGLLCGLYNDRWIALEHYTHHDIGWRVCCMVGVEVKCGSCLDKQQHRYVGSAACVLSIIAGVHMSVVTSTQHAITNPTHQSNIPSSIQHTIINTTYHQYNHSPTPGCPV